MDKHVFFDEAVIRGLVKKQRSAYEAGAAALRRQLDEFRRTKQARREAAARVEAEAIANQLKLF